MAPSNGTLPSSPLFCVDLATQEDRAANTLRPTHIKSTAFHFGVPANDLTKDLDEHLDNF